MSRTSILKRLTLAVTLALPLTLASQLTPGNATAAQPTAPASVPLDDALRQRCLKQLRDGLASGEFWPAMHAAEALSYAGLGEEVREALWPKLPEDKDDQHRCGLAREIVRAGDRRALPVLFDVLAKADPYGHTHAGESLYKIAEVGDGRALRALFRETPDLRRKLMAAAALARCGNQEAHAFIRAHVTHDAPEARKIAAWLVARLDFDLTSQLESAAEARAAIRQELVAKLRERHASETDVVTRAYQAHALAALGDATGLEQLGENLSHADNEIRTYASEMAGHVRAVALRPRLIDKLEDPWLDVRIRAAQSLILLGQPAASDPGEFARDVYVATPANPRYSEGAVTLLDNGRLLYATTEFFDSESDFASARIIARESGDGGATWGESRVIQENVGKRNVMSVSFVRPAVATRDRHPLSLYYLQKDGFRDLHVFCRDSLDDGRTFGTPRRVTAADGYHVMNNDRVVRLSNGRLVCPISYTSDVEKVNHFEVLCYLSDDGGQTWHRSKNSIDQPKRGAMEPEVLELNDGRLLVILRTQLGHIAAATSADRGETWSEAKSWGVRAPEAPASLRRVPSTGQLLLVWNNSYDPRASHSGKRTPLSAALSSDDGQTWQAPVDLETSADHTFAYTSLLFVQDRVLMTYYVRDEKSGRISSRFRSVPLARWTTAGTNRANGATSR